MPDRLVCLSYSGRQTVWSVRAILGARQTGLSELFLAPDRLVCMSYSGRQTDWSVWAILGARQTLRSISQRSMRWLMRPSTLWQTDATLSSQVTTWSFLNFLTLLTPGTLKLLKVSWGPGPSHLVISQRRQFSLSLMSESVSVSEAPLTRRANHCRIITRGQVIIFEMMFLDKD